jgi:hypothetical protein
MVRHYNAGPVRLARFSGPARHTRPAAQAKSLSLDLRLVREVRDRPRRSRRYGSLATEWKNQFGVRFAAKSGHRTVSHVSVCRHAANGFESEVLRWDCFRKNKAESKTYFVFGAQEKNHTEALTVEYTIVFRERKAIVPDPVPIVVWDAVTHYEQTSARWLPWQS